MKKIVLIIINIVLSISIFANIGFIEGKELERKYEIKSVFTNSEIKAPGAIIADLKEADYFLEYSKLTKSSLKNNQLFLILPDVDILNENIESVSKLYENVTIFLLENESHEYKMQNRSIKEARDKKYDFKKYKNVRIETFKASEEELKEVYFESLFSGIPNNIELYNKKGVIKKIYMIRNQI